MVDFAKEQVIGVQRLQKKLGVSADTIRRWFRQGLESRKLGGKRFTSLEALNRFSGESDEVDDEAKLAEAMAELRGMGVKSASTETSRDGRSQKALA
jgi:transposase-like protein